MKMENVEDIKDEQELEGVISEFVTDDEKVREEAKLTPEQVLENYSNQIHQVHYQLGGRNIRVEAADKQVNAILRAGFKDLGLIKG